MTTYFADEKTNEAPQTCDAGHFAEKHLRDR